MQVPTQVLLFCLPRSGYEYGFFIQCCKIHNSRITTAANDYVCTLQQRCQVFIGQSFMISNVGCGASPLRAVGALVQTSETQSRKKVRLNPLNIGSAM